MHLHQSEVFVVVHEKLLCRFSDDRVKLPPDVVYVLSHLLTVPQVLLVSLVLTGYSVLRFHEPFENELAVFLVGFVVAKVCHYKNQIESAEQRTRQASVLLEIFGRE